MSTLDTRLWRVRRRGEWIDAALEPQGNGWCLRYSHRRGLLVASAFETRAQALDAARIRLREFERVGWTEHW